MNTRPLENRGLRLQASLVISAFRQRSAGHALALVYPVLVRRVKEISKWCLNPVKFFTRRNRRIREFVARKLNDPHKLKPNVVGNYSAFPSLLTPESVVYSFGVGGDVRFDLALAETTSCTIHLFDPTPRAARFIAQHMENPLFCFHSWGIWTTDGPAYFFSDVTLMADSNGDVVQDYRSGSIANITEADYGFEADCLTLPSIMQRLGHHHVDLLKLDVEGAALDVIEHLLTTEMRPGQVIVEFEVPREISNLGPFLGRVESVLDRLNGDGYTFHALNRGQFHTDSIEFVAVRS
jgi:FkbM family methyltransferase